MLIAITMLRLTYTTEEALAMPNLLIFKIAQQETLSRLPHLLSIN